MGFSEGGDGGLELCLIHPAIAEGDFLQACDLEALVVFDGADELGGFEQGFVGAGVEPSVVAAEDFDVEVGIIRKPGSINQADLIKRRLSLALEMPLPWIPVSTHARAGPPQLSIAATIRSRMRSNVGDLKR